MGYKDGEKYHKNLNQQLVDRLVSMQAFGKSRNELKEKGLTEDKIFSVAAYHCYKKVGKRFVRYLINNHPECTSLKKAKKFVQEYLSMRTEQVLSGELSAYTVTTEAAALHKIFGIKKDDIEYYHPPKRNRSEIKRGRDKTPTIHNAALMEFGKGTGLRTHKELEVLHGGDYASYKDIAAWKNRLDAKKDLTADERNQLAACNAALRFTDKQHFVIVRKGKGGKLRYAPIVGQYTDEIVRRIKETPEGQRVWAGISHSMFSRMNEHQNRAEYSARIYREYARPIEKIPKDKVNAGTGKAYASEVYHGRKDMKGTAFDKYALGMCAVALGHSFNRTYDVVSHYSYLF